MRIALIADTHGALDARIADAVRGADLLVHAGDVGVGVEAELAPLAKDVVIVQGNNDPADSGWPESVRLDLPGGELAVMHGHQWPAKTRHGKLRDAFPAAAAIVCGHSHRRVLDDTTDPWVLNPGAAGRTRAYGGPGYIELTANSGRWSTRLFEYAPLSKRRR
ncbi:metallophosphoesterase family protein [Salinisphaera aquimarina]|uniref:Phosphoesterase n=1 Tax=Salinisphaera aquimarina TaxID=2094031 RepID=A0ABV7EQC5_9GAMM